MSYNVKTGMYEGYIYCIENLINGKRYIGYTKNDIETRWKQHLSKTHHREDNSILHLAIQKYKEYNFKIYAIHTEASKTIDELMRKLKLFEPRYIKLFNTLSPNGYNVLSGGETVPINRITPVYQYTIDGILVNNYKSITEAIQINGFNDNPKNSKISYCMKTNHYAFGYLWNTNDNEDVVVLYNSYQRPKKGRHAGSKRSKSVICITTNEVFLTVHDACEKYNINSSALIRVCENKRVSCGKHPVTGKKLIWKYVDNMYV